MLFLTCKDCDETVSILFERPVVIGTRTLKQLINKRYDTQLMHQSFAIPAPRGRGIAGLMFLKRLFFGSKEALLKALHFGAKFVVKSALIAPPPGIDNDE